MTVTEYAQHIAALSNWTAGKIDNSTAYYHWEKLLKAGYATVAVPSRADWPSQLKRPATAQDPDPGVWGSWKHLLAAVSPVGMFALMLGDDEFRGEVAQAAEEGAAATLDVVTGGMGPWLPLLGLGAVGLAIWLKR